MGQTSRRDDDAGGASGRRGDDAPGRRRDDETLGGHDDGQTWTSVDAWLLAATSSAAEGCTLTDLVATADGINHAVPSTAELADSLAHLIGSGMLLWHGDRLLLTPAGRAIHRSWRHGLFSWSKALMPRLRTVPRVRGDLPFGTGELDAARAAYRARH